MIIKNSAIQFSSQYQFLKSSQESASLRIWKTQDPAANKASPNKDNPLTDAISLSKPIKTEKQSPDLHPDPDANHGVMLQIVQQLVKALTGHGFKIFSADELTANPDNGTPIDTSNDAAKTTPPTENQLAPAGFGLAYEHRTTYQESESTSFTANGTIKTQDGKSIEFSVKLNMSREFLLETSQSVSAGVPEKKMDPLVINFDGHAAQLSQTHFEFDIDSNGNVEQLATLNPGSGFLALDKNKDGVINNGSELFGPNSGNGFSELGAYDSDNNNFIDEADPIYKNLKIWQQRENGSQQLVSLSAKNIGAIYLGHAPTPFQIRTPDNKSLGEVTHTGIYLTENGETGTIQQLNLTV